MKTYDAVIIGAGHNALVSAAALAKAGKSVLVLERRNILGGICVSEALDAGPQAEPVISGGYLRPDIVRDLDLVRFGLPPAPVRTNLVSLLPGSRQLVLSANVNETTASIAAFSKADAVKWAGFVAFMDKAAAFLEAAYATTMPRLPKFPVADGLPLVQLGLKLRELGPKDMYAVIRLLPMTVREFLDEWFETDALKAAIASLGIHNANLGVMSAGSAYNLLHQYLIRGGWGQPQLPGGGLAQIPAALAAAARSHGAEIRANAEVTRICITDGQVSGVQLAGGEQIQARAVISGADPKRTFLTLTAPEHLDPEFVWKVSNIKMRGVTARLHLVVAEDLELPNGTLVIAPSLNYLERAYDAAKYGQLSAQPCLEISRFGQVVSVHIQFAPYHLKDSAWDAAARARLEALTLDTLDLYLPDLRSKIKSQQSLIPLDLETTYALTEGDPHHGQLMLDQFFFMRPLPGWSNHATPVAGLYLCGSGTHGGGGISGIPGRNAARQLLKAG